MKCSPDTKKLETFCLADSYAQMFSEKVPIFLRQFKSAELKFTNLRIAKAKAKNNQFLV